jgi:hypothetical protein
VSHPRVGTAQPKRHTPGWNGTSNASRTRKSPSRGSKSSRHKKHQSNGVAPSKIAHRITDLWPLVGDQVTV